MPGTAADAVNYLVRWADELRGLSLATLADGSILIADRDPKDQEYCIFRVPPPATVAK